MRRFLFPLLGSFTIFLAAYMPQQALAQKGTPTDTPIIDIQPGQKVGNAPTDLDPLVNLLAASLTSWQDANAQSLGRYVQMLTAFSAPPIDGIALVPDLVNAKPTNEQLKAADVWAAVKWPTALPASVSVDVYDGPSGKGYVVQVLTKFNGVLWAKAVNSGPERWRDSNWAAQTVGP